jgi:hypothetical protein
LVDVDGQIRGGYEAGDEWIGVHAPVFRVQHSRVSKSSLKVKLGY